MFRFPNNKVARIAFSWHGPAPYQGEFKSHYLWRWVLYALNWLAQIIGLFAVGYLIVWWRPAWGETTAFLAIWAFALPLFAGMAIFGAALAALAALKAKFLGPNPVFSEATHEV